MSNLVMDFWEFFCSSMTYRYMALCLQNWRKIYSFGMKINKCCFRSVNIIILKIVCNENQGWSGRWHTFGIGIGSRRSMFFWLLILLSSLFYCISVSATSGILDCTVFWWTSTDLALMYAIFWQGLPFYAVEGKPLCERDYTNTLEKCCKCFNPILDRILRATGEWVA